MVGGFHPNGVNLQELELCSVRNYAHIHGTIAGSLRLGLLKHLPSSLFAHNGRSGVA